MSLHHGALLLDDPTRLRNGAVVQAGTVAVDGEATVAVLEDFIRDIRQDVVYLTNIPYACMRQAGLQHRATLRCDDYFATRVPALLAEAGMVDSNPEERARWLASLHRQVLQLASDHLDVPAHPDGRTLAVAIRKAFLKERAAPADPEQREALQEAYQRVTFTAILGGASASGRPIALRFHRQSYAESMLRISVPFGSWRSVEPPREGDSAAWAMDLAQGNAALFQIRVRFVGPKAREIARIVNIGSGARAVATEWGRSVNPRTWVAGPELEELAAIAEVTVERCRIADELVDNPFSAYEDAPFSRRIGPANGVPLSVGPVSLTGRAQIDYCTGLLVESLWQSLIAVRSDQVDPTAVWVASNDRANCMRAALTVMMSDIEGVTVTGFSKGQLWLRVRDDDSYEAMYARIATAACAAKMVPPAMPTPPKASPRLQLANQLVKEITHRSADPGRLCAARTILGERPLVLSGCA